MARTSKLLTQELHDQAVSQLQKVPKDTRLGMRLQAIISAKTYGMGAVAKVFNTTATTLRTWVRRFADEGLDGLEYKPGRGRKESIRAKQQDIVKQWVRQDSNLTLKQIRIKLKQEYKVKTSKSSVHRLLEKLKLAYITPRSQHYKQDKNQQEEFKKKSKAAG